MWHVSSRSGVATLRTNCYTRVTTAAGVMLETGHVSLLLAQLLLSVYVSSSYN